MKDLKYWIIAALYFIIPGLLNTLTEMYLIEH